MAKVELSALLDSLTGKLAGSVFQYTVGGLQMRTRVSPRNPATTPQQFTRSQYSYQRLIWPLLTAPQRSSWIDNSPGDVPGSSFFVSQNQKIALAGGSLLDTFTPGTAPVLTSVTYSDLNPSKALIAVTGDTSPLPADNYLNVFVCVPLSPGKNFISPSGYVFLKSFPPGTDLGTDLDITTEYLAKYGSLPIDFLIGVRVYIIDIVTGISSNTVDNQANVS